MRGGGSSRKGISTIPGCHVGLSSLVLHYATDGFQESIVRLVGMAGVDAHVVGIFFAKDFASSDLFLEEVEFRLFGRFDFHAQESVFPLVEEL